MTKRSLVLVVLDGWGLREDRNANAIALARTPIYRELVERFPHTSLLASGEAVGLPSGQMGNSEVGHMNMGAGRVVYQDLTRIDKAIQEGEFFENPVIQRVLSRCADGRHSLHLLGLLSDGGVHSHEHHLHALIRMAARHSVPNVFVHAITDGRDTSPTSALRYLSRLENVMAKESVGRVSTVSGRYYAMDRDKRWERTRRAYDALTLGAGRLSTSAISAVEASYLAGVTDEFVEPTVIVDGSGTAIGRIRDGDSVVFFNFRSDRARQLTYALTDAAFSGFDRTNPVTVEFACFTEYDATLMLPVAFPPDTFSSCLADVLAAQGIKNLRLAETEKYAHVTYFFNCGEEKPFPGEDRLLIPSPKVATYDLKPEMSAPQITDALVADVNASRHRVIVCNFANADMVGHTGKLEAAVAAVETLDKCLGRIVTAVSASGGAVVVTSDHGNCELMWDNELNSPHTAHTSNPVPFILVDPDRHVPLRSGGRLCDVAPTILGLLDIRAPEAMIGRDLRDL